MTCIDSSSAATSIHSTSPTALLPRFAAAPPQHVPADVMGRGQLRALHRGLHQNAAEAGRQVTSACSWPCLAWGLTWQ